MNVVSMIIILSLLTACTHTVKSLDKGSENIKDLSSDKGYLLIGVETEYSLKNVSIDGPDFIRLSYADLKKGSNFILLPLDSGEYNITEINYNHYWKSKPIDEDKWFFTIKPQTISYVGHLQLEKNPFYSEMVDIEIVNRSTEALDFMKLNFPSILNEREIFYGGAGEDHYFEYLKEISQ